MSAEERELTRIGWWAFWMFLGAICLALLLGMGAYVWPGGAWRAPCERLLYVFNGVLLASGIILGQCNLAQERLFFHRLHEMDRQAQQAPSRPWDHPREGEGQ